MKWFRVLALLLAALGASERLGAQVAPELQEPDVLYFADNLPAKIVVRLNAATTIYLARNFQSALAALPPGTEIELVGMAPEGYLLKASYRNNTVNGWIRPEDLPTGIDPALFDQARKMQAHRDAVAVAIANKTVIKDMSPDEVKQAVGRPEQTSVKSDAGGTTEVWTYTTYRDEPQYAYGLDPFGRPVVRTYYVKVPIGRLVVTFQNSVVTAFEQTKVDPNSPGGISN